MNKKYIIIILIFIAFFFIYSFITPTPLLLLTDSIDSPTKVTAVLDTEINEKNNLVYCCTFQQAWNKLSSDSGETIEISDAPDYIHRLNVHKNLPQMISDDACVVMVGLSDYNTPNKIYEQLNEKFYGKLSLSEIKPDIDIQPGLLYAFSFVFKQLLFNKIFNEKNLNFKNNNINKISNVKAFGIDSKLELAQKRELWDQIELFHDTQPITIFVIKIKTQSKTDELIISNFQPEKTLEKSFKKINNYISDPKNQQTPNINSTLTIPKIDFNINMKYEKIIGKGITTGKYKGHLFTKVFQKIKFQLNERGSVLYSFFEGTALMGLFPQHYIINGPFFVYLKNKDSSLPYFMLYIANDEFLIK